MLTKRYSQAANESERASASGGNYQESDPMGREFKVVITNPVAREVLEPLSRTCTVLANMSRLLSREETLQKAYSAHAILVFKGDTIDRPFLEQCPNLLIVATTFQGSEGVDVGACTESGVWVTTVPPINQCSAGAFPLYAMELLSTLEAVANVLEVLSGDRPKGAVNNPLPRRA